VRVNRAAGYGLGRPAQSQEVRVAANKKIKLLYREEVLALVGCSYPTLLGDVRRGLLAPARHIGHRAAWTQAEIEEYLDRLPRQKLRGPRSVAAS